MPAQSRAEPLTTLRAEREAAEARDRRAWPGCSRTARPWRRPSRRPARPMPRPKRATPNCRPRRQALAAAGRTRGTPGEQGDDLEAVLESLARHSGELRDSPGRQLADGGEPTCRRAWTMPRCSTLEHLEALADALMALTAETGRAVALRRAGGRPAARSPRGGGAAGRPAPSATATCCAAVPTRATLSVVERTPREVAASLAPSRPVRAFPGARPHPRPGHRPWPSARAWSSASTRAAPWAMWWWAWGHRPAGGAGCSMPTCCGSPGHASPARDLDRLRDDNPLGRVLQRFRALDDDPVPEALEARLDEAVLAELPRSSVASHWSSCSPRWRRCWACWAPSPA
jgi:biopolymer transport protein ExbB